MESSNRKIYSYQKSGITKFIRIIAEGFVAIGEGMERQHDEDLMIKKNPHKESH